MKRIKDKGAALLLVVAIIASTVWRMLKTMVDDVDKNTGQRYSF